MSEAKASKNSLHQAYINARYVLLLDSSLAGECMDNMLIEEKVLIDIFNGSNELVFRVDHHNKKLKELILINQCKHATFITACNPMSQILDEKENQHRVRLLEQYLIDRGYSFLTGYSDDDAGQWPTEYSFFVLDLPLAEAKLLATKYQQKAYLWVDCHGQVNLIDTNEELQI